VDMRAEKSGTKTRVPSLIRGARKKGELIRGGANVATEGKLARGGKKGLGR